MSLSGPESPDRNPSFRLSAILVAIAVVIAFHEAPFLDFVDYDDDVIALNPALKNGLSGDALRFALTETPTNLWHPLTYLSHALDFEIFGSWAGGHHLTNVVFHLATSLLLLFWLRRFTGETGLALAVTLLFAIHPLRVESVIWISERKDVLSAFFYLLTVTFYSLWTKDRTPGRRRWYHLAIASALLGLLSKPSLMTLPAALLLIDFWPLRRLDLTRLHRIPSLGRRLLEKVPFLVIALTAAVVAWFTWSGNQFIGDPPDLSLAERTGYALLAYLSYLSLTFFPEGMVAFRTYPPDIDPMAVGLAIALLALFLFAAIRWRQQRPWLLFGGLWFVGLILPGSGLVTISDHFAPDRYTYLAHVGLFMILVWGAAMLGERFQVPAKVGWTLLVASLLPLLFLTYQQSKTWENAGTLWKHAISVSDGNYVAYNQLGLHYLKSDRFEEGISELHRAIEAYPDFPLSYGNLSMAYGNQGNFSEAVDWFLKAGPELPERDLYRDRLIRASLAAGESTPVEELWRRLIEETPDDPALHLGSADFLYEQGKRDQALAGYRKAVALDPSNSQANLSLGALLLQSGKVEEALPFLQQSAATAPDEKSKASARRTLAQALLLQKEWRSAIEQYADAVSLAPNDPLYVNELAQLLLDCPDPDLRDPARALTLATTLPVRGENGIAPNPRHLRTLARALARNGNPEGAAQVASAGLQVVDDIADTQPLPEPWTQSELDSLRTGFQRLIGTPES